MNTYKKNLFYCYSINLFHFLKAKGFYYTYRGLNENSKKNYWIFERTPEFLNALGAWDEYKKNN